MPKKYNPLVWSQDASKNRLCDLTVGDRIKIFLLGGRYGLGKLLEIKSNTLVVDNELTGKVEGFDLGKIILIQLKNARRL